MAPLTSASSPAPTAQLSRVSHAQSSNSWKLIIAAIVLGCLIFVVILVAVVVPLVRRRSYKRVPNTKTMANMNESQERVKVPQQYRKGHRPTQSEIVGMMPLLRNPRNRLSVVLEERSSYMSTASREHQIVAFVDANDEGVVKEFDPYDLSRSSSCEPPNLLPTVPQLITPAIPSRTFRALSPPPRLPPLIIPGLNDSPTPKPTRKASTRSAAGSDDSASIYSQASASTYTAYRTTNVFPFSVSSIQPVPALPDHVKSQSAAPRLHTLAHFPLLSSSSSTTFTEVPIASRDDETTLTRGDTLFVGQLLKSRARDATPPSRSSTQISHIERAGSIKPAILEEEEQFGSRYRIKNRVGRRKMRIKENIRPNSPLRTLDEAPSPGLSEPPASPPRAFDRDGPLANGVAPQTPALRYPPLKAPAFYTETAPLNITGAKEKISASSE